MRLCSKPRGARRIEPDTFRRRGQLFVCPPTTGPHVHPVTHCPCQVSVILPVCFSGKFLSRGPLEEVCSTWPCSHSVQLCNNWRAADLQGTATESLIESKANRLGVIALCNKPENERQAMMTMHALVVALLACAAEVLLLQQESAAASKRENVYVYGQRGL